MNRPVRTTLVFGLISAIAVIPTAWSLTGPIGWPMAFKLALWTDLVAYALMLARWSGKSPVAISFPAALLLGTALWPGVTTGFFFLALGIFSWIRSGICFSGTPLRSVTAEIITLAGGAGLVALLAPGSSLTRAVCIWLFFLVQTLYFFIVPTADPTPVPIAAPDPFEQAHREALRVLEED